ncbi:unnamed protein product [Prorocentrum cordatum]|uniref:Uncharacterized protein n=1 Tax=Prorocentrum cordatum TaxID=2364126 RepID=A0ABN9PT76_9DINO|nr:unnamed protein product [Polarella glacialis]
MLLTPAQLPARPDPDRARDRRHGAAARGAGTRGGDAGTAGGEPRGHARGAHEIGPTLRSGRRKKRSSSSSSSSSSSIPTPPSSGSARSSSGGRRCCKKFGGRRGRGSQASRRREAEARDVFQPRLPGLTLGGTSAKIGGISETGRRATVAPHRGPCADLRRVSCSRGAIPPRVAQPSTARCRRRPQAPEQGPKVQAFGASAARVEPSRSLGNLSVGPSEAWACAGLAGRCAARALETARAS